MPLRKSELACVLGLLGGQASSSATVADMVSELRRVCGTGEEKRAETLTKDELACIAAILLGEKPAGSAAELERAIAAFCANHKPGANQNPEKKGPEKKGPEKKGPENKGPEKKGPEKKGFEKKGSLAGLLAGLPGSGVVSVSGSYYYLALGAAWQRASEEIVELVAKEEEKLVGEAKHLVSKLPKDVQKGGVLTFYAPQSPVGLHVTLDPESGEQLLGETLRFGITQVHAFQHERIGQPSSFSKNPLFFHVLRVVADVKLLAPKGKPIPCPHACHISLANLGQVVAK